MVTLLAGWMDGFLTRKRNKCLLFSECLDAFEYGVRCHVQTTCGFRFRLGWVLIYWFHRRGMNSFANTAASLSLYVPEPLLANLMI